MAETKRERRSVAAWRRRLEVDTKQSDELIDADAWARSFVLAVLRLDGEVGRKGAG